MILKGGLSMAQPGDHWLKKAMSLAWAKSSPALIYHSFLPHDTPCVCGPGNQHASQFGGKRGKESRKKEEDRDGAVEPVSLGATSPFPHPTPPPPGLELQILGLHRSIIHLICLCPGGLGARLIDWFEVFPLTLGSYQILKRGEIALLCDES